MNAEQLPRAIYKGLEIWSLQSLCDVAIMMSFAILALVAGRAHLDKLKRGLTLRVASEVWETGADLLVDVLLFGVVLAGLFFINPDIMADIKIGVPWVPLAMVLLAVALVLRACHGGRVIGSTAWWVAFVLIVLACAANWFGFTFVMEAAGDEYIKDKTQSLWPVLQRMRSDKNPELALLTFQLANPALVLVFLWGIIAGVIQTRRGVSRES
jgi:hypothetical protein